MLAESELRIPTKKLTVKLILDGDKTHSVVLHLAEHEQNLIDLLQTDQSFMPVRDAADGSWCIVNKSSLLWASIILQNGRLPINVDVDEEALYDKQAKIEVHLASGESLEGKILYSPPQGRGRVTDHMNRPAHFFRLWTPDHLYLVNKSRVLRIVEIDEGA